MTEAQALAIFNKYIDDATNTETEYLKQSLLYLNNFFGTKNQIDSSLSTSVDSNLIDISSITNIDKIKEIYIDDEFIEKKTKIDGKKDLIKNEVQKWEHIKDKIQFTQEFDGVYTVKIVFSKKFIWPSSGDFDLDDKLFDLFFLGALLRYNQMLLIRTMTNREKTPDVNPEELRKSIETIKEEFWERLNKIKKNE